jgi:hypothetical protein
MNTTDEDALRKELAEVRSTISRMEAELHLLRKGWQTATCDFAETVRAVEDIMKDLIHEETALRHKIAWRDELRAEKAKKGNQ